MRVGICDDDRFMTGKIEEELLAIGKEYGFQLDIEVFFDGAELWKDIQDNGSYDILYLDIEMKQMDGLSVAKKIRKNDPYTVLIFVSAHDSYCKSLFDVETFRFLDKPVDWKKFRKDFLAAFQKITDINQRITFSYNKKTYQVPYKEIIYFEKRMRTVHIYTDRREYMFYGSIDDVWEQMKAVGKHFIRVSKAHIVNYNHIESLNMSKLNLDNGVILTLRKEYKEDAWRRYAALMSEF
ncbi:MAG: LytTR family DNA-binding domain-containing protein [Bacillota bacterium]|nr:LytTR family DNA-binding domain-containing protein [Bacillota bacterium]